MSLNNRLKNQALGSTNIIHKYGSSVNYSFNMISIQSTLAPGILTLGLFLSSAFGDIILSGNALFDTFKADGVTPLPDGQLVLIVVDRSRDGFSAGMNLGLTVGDDISNFVGNADDIIIGRTLTETIGLVGRAVPASSSVDPLTVGGIDEGDPFGLFFFDGLGAGDTTVTDGVTFGFQEDGLNWLLKPNGSNTEFGFDLGEYPTFSNVSASNRVAAIPEPSAPLLCGILTVLSLITRRRTARVDRQNSAGRST